MRGRWALASAAVAVAAAAGAVDWRDPPAAGGTGVGGAWSDVCTLVWADRARTPSSACISCHDGSAGTAVSLAVRGAVRDSHPVGVDYADVATRNPDRYEPRSALPASVPLVDGRVECTTCHDGRSSTQNRIVEQARFCTACHRF